MHCIKCGHKLEEGAAFCPICGTNVNQDVSQTIEQPSQAPNKNQSAAQLRPDSNLVWGILTTLLCCLPFGIVSIIYAAQVDTLWVQGLYDESRAASKKAGKWAMWAAISFAIVLILYFILVFGLGFAIFTGSLNLKN